MYVKDLIMLDPDDRMPIWKVLSALGSRLPPLIGPDWSLKDTLKCFQKTHKHLGIVKHPETQENLGIITLEDVLERILQQALVDEHDNYGL